MLATRPLPRLGDAVSDAGTSPQGAANSERRFDQDKEAEEHEVLFLRHEIAKLEQRLHESGRTEGFEKDLTQALSQNERLAAALREAREQILVLKEQVERLTAPPSGFGIFMGTNPDGTVNISSGGRKLRVNVHPSIDIDSLRYGQEVMLNEALNITEVRSFEVQGEVVKLSQRLGKDRAIVIGNADEERVVQVAEPLHESQMSAGDSLLLDVRSGLVIEHIPALEVQVFVRDRVPNVTYREIGGLEQQVLRIRNLIELPLLNEDAFARYELKPPKGILLYGPPGCGKTMIAIAVANSVANWLIEHRGSDASGAFLYIKGPELLNKYVGESERRVRLLFDQARNRSMRGLPTIFFFDEMDSIFRSRTSGSDAETLLMSQLLSELDGIDPLDNTIVLSATNREDTIDPAILRPGRFDVKIEVDRPNAEGAMEIFRKYLKPSLPMSTEMIDKHSGDRERALAYMIEQTVEKLYARSEESRFVEVEFVNGEREVLYFGDFCSGAIIKNIVARAKGFAVERYLEIGRDGLILSDLLRAVDEEFSDTEKLATIFSSSDWARISGKSGQRIAYVRTSGGFGIEP
jgi:proteasome-associated ATPase